MTIASALIMLAQVGFADPQAHEIALYFAQATHGPGRVTAQTELHPCARSRFGEGLVDVTRGLRVEMHQFANVPMAECVPAEQQVAYLAWAFPAHYPRSAARFAAGDLSEFQKAWGWGEGR